MADLQPKRTDNTAKSAAVVFGWKTNLLTLSWIPQYKAWVPAVIIHKKPKLQRDRERICLYIRHGTTLDLQIPVFNIDPTMWLLSFEVMQESERNKDM